MLREPGTAVRPGGGQSLRRDPEKPSQDKKKERWKIIWGFSIFPGAKLNTHAGNPRKNRGLCFSGGIKCLTRPLRRHDYLLIKI